MQCRKYTLTVGMCKKQQHQFHVSSLVCSYSNVQQCTAYSTAHKHRYIVRYRYRRMLVSAVAYIWTKIFKDSHKTGEITVVKSEVDESLPQFFFNTDFQV